MVQKFLKAMGFASFDPYNKFLNDKPMRETVPYRADISSTTYERNAEELALIHKKIDKVSPLIDEAQSLKNEKANELEKDLLRVYFADGADTIRFTKLSSRSILLIQRHFGGVEQRKDNSYLFNGEAANFLRGWYDEVARNLNYKNADENKDGLIDDVEKLELKSVFTPQWFGMCYDNPTLTIGGLKAYEKFGSIRESLREPFKDFFTSDTLALALDKIVLMDDNFDGKVLYTDFDKYSYHDFIKADISAMIGDDPFGGAKSPKELEKLLEKYKKKIQEEFAKRVEDKVKHSEKDDEKAKIYTKLLTQGFESLKPEEKEMAQKFFSKLCKEVQDVEKKMSDLVGLFKDLFENSSFSLDNAFLDFRV